MDGLINIKTIDKYDVVVVGGGPAGFAAGVSASRKGCKTLLIEGNGCLGGTSTSGALPFMLGATTGSIPFPKMIAHNLQYSELPHPRKAVGGIFDEVVTKIKSENGGIGPCKLAQTDKYPGLDRLGCHDEFTFDIEIGKRCFDDMAIESGLDVFYYTHAVDTLVENNTIKGVYISNKSGLQFVPCEVLIDCSGDADMVERSGYKTIKGDKITGEMIAVGFVTHIENIDASKIEKHLKDGNDPWFRDICKKAKEENPEIADDLPSSLIIFPMLQDGVFMVNDGTNEYIDGTSGKELSEHTFWGRHRAKMLTEVIFKKYIPGCENCRLRLTAQYPGIRETRRIVAEYELTEMDALYSTHFDDTIALAGRHFDLSRKNGGQTFANKYTRPKDGIVSIPYRALIPKNSNNIVVAGRCIDAEGQALGPARIMSTCMAVGQAAGTAAAIKVKNNFSRFIDIDVENLKNELRQDGAEIDT